MHTRTSSLAVAAIAATWLWSAGASGQGAGQTTYQKPPAAIERLLDAPSTPTVEVSPDRRMMVVLQGQDFPSIAEVAEPRYRLAGLRFNPGTSGPSAETVAIGMRLAPIVPGTQPRAITGLPAKLRASHAMWSPDSRYVAFVQRHDVDPKAKPEIKTGRSRTSTAPGPGLELWVVDASTLRARRIGAFELNAILGRPCAWMPDSTGLLCKIVPQGRGPAPVESTVPTGPDVQENLGRVSPAPTYEDLLKNESDARIFEFYATSELAVVPLAGGLRMLPVTGMVGEADPSPDGQYALMAELHRPFSYTLPEERFPLKTTVVGIRTGSTHMISDRPLVDNLPISRDAVSAGPRDIRWRSDQPNTVAWVEAADGGNPKTQTPVRDRILMLAAPFNGQPETALELPMRFRNVEWGNAHLAVAEESRWSDRKSAMLAFDPATGKSTTLYEGSSQDRYHNPGRPVTIENAQGQRVLETTPDGRGIYLYSEGASPSGDKPFVGVLPVAGGPETRLWQSEDPFYSSPVAIVADKQVLVRRESETVSPDYYLAGLSFSGHASDNSLVRVTSLPSPFAGINLPTHQLLKYKRADGVELTATLWLPYGYSKAQGPLPTLMEAYPAEFKTRAAASQVAGSPNRFPVMGWGGSPIYFAMTGYAVLQNAAIPIIGEGDAQPNDTYVEQLVAGAKAAVDYSASLGFVDPKRVGVMGHSYGAFMTANLLAHTNMFRAGIARSGAYNRTLTPYGFQNEERTYWQAPEVYNAMSPFMFADKIKTPILLIHGEADDNTGTYPIQSERFYAALKGQGATVRLVFLPLEAHHYAAHESLQHMLWEMNRWLDTYVKPEVSPVKTASAGE